MDDTQEVELATQESGQQLAMATEAAGNAPEQDGADSSGITALPSGSRDEEDQIIPEALPDDEYNPLITEILRVLPANPLGTGVACLISDAGGGKYYGADKVRIGPFQRQDPAIQSADRMEQEKKRVLRGLLITSNDNEEDEAGRREQLRSHLEAMGVMEPAARLCYDGTYRSMTRMDFTGMLLLDGFFLYSRFVSGSIDDIIVDRDIMFLLENQIPFFVLDKIHQLLTGPFDECSSHFVLDKVAERVQRVLQHNKYIATTNVHVQSPGEDRPCHLLHLLYMYFTPAAILGSDILIDIQVNSAPVPEIRRWRRATEYYAAGVGLVKRELHDDGARSILDVDLIKDQLHIPRLIINSNTFRMLRNMVALEHKSLHQTCRSSHVTDYCLFLSQIAGTEEDVELLVSKGIIIHLLHSNHDVAQGLAGLYDDHDYDLNLSYLSSKNDALDKLVKSTWRRSKAWLRLNPLKALLGVLVAPVVSVATVLQLAFAGLSYRRGH
ncbi:uncharacterized protein LOC112271806 isoform X2 [Brachypodium distachyon]|uniref:Uncharacterized protein n=1 Tax=Brachypodium distachyon TaxID=15368 RepID=A0A0Q3PZI2_BRADI|nr:uncharacterized protein LOC112271806 isoform X2 [Brachypodium distachyon]KQJ94833.1 hypothetical protein BRADI_3g13501v3 [Brachypodium distachyon]|eukprot:XP_024317748.1 uncharacterized protein LOC112271806 isoform X2 [Brachypodium distachyon]